MTSLVRGVVKTVLSGAMLAAMASVPAQAATVALGLNDGWNVFYFGDGFPDESTSFQDLYGNDLSYTFTLTAPTVLSITDGYYDGDQFDVTINGVDQGATSTPAFDGTDIGDNWSAALDSPSFSHAIYDLAPGGYTVTGFTLQDPFGVGAGAIALGAVPEPAAWATMLLGFLGVGAALRRRGMVRAA